MIEFDCESTGLQPWSGKQKAFLFQFYDGKYAEALKPDQHRDRIQGWFENGRKNGIRAWNSNFDRAFAEQAGFNVPSDDAWHDGLLLAHTINERRSMALKSIGAELLGDARQENQKAVKDWLSAERARRKKAAKENGQELVEPNFSDVPDELMVPYGLEDVYLTREICSQLEPIIEQTPKLKNVYEFEREVMNAIYRMEKRGLPADEPGYRKLELEVIENLDRLEDRAVTLAKEAGVEDFNPKSTQQIIQALEKRHADMSLMTHEKGKVKSADRENLLAVDDELADAVLKFRSEFKVLSTYVRPMIGRHYDKGMRSWFEPFISPDGRIHASYRQLGARTGRMSCSNPNIQNQPRDDLRLRYNIRAEPGHKLVAVDLSNIEMRLFAAYAGEGKLIDAVEENADLHTLTASMIGINEHKRTGGAVESARQRGKTYNFAIIYGGGLRTITKQLRVDMDQARRLRKRYYDAYPEVQRLQQRIEFRLIDQGYIEDLWGRRYRCFDARKEAFKFVNYLIQGTASQILKDAVVSLDKDGVPVVALIHDEIVAHVKETDAPEIQALIEKRLTQQAATGGRLWDEGKKRAIVPLTADGHIVERWSQVKDPAFIPNWAR